MNVQDIILAIASFASAFGLKGIWDYWLQSDQQEHDQASEWTQRVEDRLDKAESRMDESEAALYKEQKKTAMLEANTKILQTSIRVLVERVDQLLDRLEKHETITPSERASLTSVPHRTVKER
jgi:predicted nuclease with TOPRIM domain